MQRDRGKSKALRIRLDYYRQRGWHDQARLVALVLGGLVGLLYGGWVLWGGTSMRGLNTTHLSTGPLAQVHASFEDDCARCHAHGLTVALGRHTSVWDDQPRLNHQEQACQQCHRVDTHFRHKLREPAEDRDCALCHQEHQGRDKSLSRVADEACIACHKSLSDACLPGQTSIAQSVITSFDVQGHGVIQGNQLAQFRSLLKDTGRVKFDHAQHLQPGQVDPGHRGGMRLDMLSSTNRERFRRVGQGDDALVQLDCESCHSLHTLEPRGDHAAPDQAGRYYAPIDFQRHCAACHQMTFPGQTGDLLPLPHVATRKEYELLLSAKAPGKPIAMRSDVNQTAPVRSQSHTDAWTSSNATVELIMGRCLQCHFEADLTDQSLDAALGGTLEPLIPSRWLVRGSFDHAAHKRIERCQYCHQIPGTDSLPSVSGPATDHQRVFIGGPETCIECHRAVDQPLSDALSTPEKVANRLGAAAQPTWSSAQCTVCHRYHFTRSAELSAMSRNDEAPR